MRSGNSLYSRTLSTIAIGLAIVIPIWLYYLIPENLSRQNARLLKEAIDAQKEQQVMLVDLVPFEWDRLYLFDPDIPRSKMIKATGLLSPLFREVYGESIRNIVFIKGKKVVCSIQGTPDTLGYDLSLREQRDPKQHFQAVYAEDLVRLCIVKQENYIQLLEY